MWTSIFANSPIIKWLKLQVDALLGSLGSTPPDFENTKTDVRAIVGYNDDDYIGCYENDYVYQFDATEITADNDDTILTPGDIIEPAPGRWVKIKSYSLAGHSHSQYAENITGGTENNVVTIGAGDTIKDSGDKLSNYITKKPAATEGYIPVFGASGDLDGEPLNPDDLDPGSAIDDKMDKIDGVVAGDVGKIIAVDAEGNAAMEAYKTVDTSYDWSGVVFGDDGITTLPISDCPYLISSDENYIYINVGAHYFVRAQIVKTQDLTGNDKPF